MMHEVVQFRCAVCEQPVCREVTVLPQRLVDWSARHQPVPPGHTALDNSRDAWVANSHDALHLLGAKSYPIPRWKACCGWYGSVACRAGHRVGDLAQGCEGENWLCLLRDAVLVTHARTPGRLAYYLGRTRNRTQLARAIRGMLPVESAGDGFVAGPFTQSDSVERLALAQGFVPNDADLNDLRDMLEQARVWLVCRQELRPTLSFGAWVWATGMAPADALIQASRPLRP